ncbi:uncharacterized protein LOC116523327 isoform X2 [Thamnophis elegans]|uniref:uncharacterized protein LOC116523327 isoform X2 n=1 Tax=Thamnophis elegans TaxID=35005 RepID=UPI001378AA4B|nr:uncharacterized protein LOC116523327 isoform X2 [Thamnophis elegans]
MPVVDVPRVTRAGKIARPVSAPSDSNAQLQVVRNVRRRLSIIERQANAGHGAQWGNDLILLVTSAFIIIIALCVAFMVLCYFFLRYWLRKKFPKPSHGQLAQEVDDCSYRYPEEEEGGSCEALSSLKGGLLERYYTQDV